MKEYFDYEFVEFIEVNENDSAESIVEKLNDWSKRTLDIVKNNGNCRNNYFLGEPFENVCIRFDYYPKAILKTYDSIVQYWSACILHVLHMTKRLKREVIDKCKKLLKLSRRQEEIIWKGEKILV